MRSHLLLLAIGLALCAELALAETPTSQPAPVTVAVMTFESKAPGNPELGAQVADIVTARLSVSGRFVVVERAQLDELLKEQKLVLRGLTNGEKAAQVGKLVGAQLMVFGRIFPVGKELYAVPKIVGVETGKLRGTDSIPKIAQTDDLSALIDQTSILLAKAIEEHADELLPARHRLVDPLAELAKKLSGKKLPTIAVVVPEEHRTRQVLDPAAETEIKRVLGLCGYPLVDVGQNALADWAKRYRADKARPWPQQLSGADIVIVGEAFSEYAGQYEQIITCVGRLEANAIDRATGRIIVADQSTQRAPDLAEALAGKTALQKCGHEVGMRLASAIARHAGAWDQ